MRGLLQYFGYALAGVTIGTALAAGACSANDSSGSGGAGGSSGFDASGATGGVSGTGAMDASSGGSGGSVSIDGATSDVISPDAACDLQKYEATLKKKPVDIIFIVDNSCSMNAEAQGIEDNINVNFAQIIQTSGIDFRVILIAEHGPTSAGSMCIEPPLSGGPCATPTVPSDTPPVNNAPVFFHYDANDVESHDGWCKSFVWATQPDRYQLVPTGWLDLLRPDAFKSFVMISDDGVHCRYGPPPSESCSIAAGATNPCDYDDTDSTQGVVAALKFDTALQTLSPTHFGTPAKRNYVWHSIVGVVAKPTGDAYEPTEPLVTTKCSSAVDTSFGNQQLSILTGGLRFPVCEGLGFDAVFKKIAEGVIEGAGIECEFPMPEPPPGKELDPATITIEFTPTSGPKLGFEQVGSAAQCKPNAFYIENDEIKLCPDTCTTVQADQNAKVDIFALCKPDIAR